jgi:hypothetical protein
VNYILSELSYLKEELMKVMRLLILTSLVVIAAATGSRAADFRAGLLVGYTGGLGFRASGMVSNFAAGFPLGLEAGVTFTSLDPGRAPESRRIFINDATNGTPEKSGSRWDLRLDFLHRVRMLGLNDASLFAGVRHSRFTANFKFVGGNEDFDVTSNQWGVGFGLRAAFPVSQRLSFVLSGGVDWYFSGTLYGHDTSYSPDGETVNGRHNYTFSDADEAVNQPTLLPVGLFGLTYSF